ncbi:MAG: HlyD family secretion protein [Betaproteobacteria bacterium]|nr:MAG: HlyD family secretion protein [Betaproteobacteria bacterium]
MTGAKETAVIAMHWLLRLVFIVVVPVAVALAGLYIYAHGGERVETENAYVKADIIAVSSELDGRVSNVEVEDNQYVQKGALLFGLEHAGYEVKQRRAEAQMDMVRTEVASLKAEYRATMLEKREATQRIAYLAKQLDRQKTLMKHGMGRADQFDEAQHNLDVAKVRLASVEERTNRVLAGLLGNPSLPAERHPRYLEAKAAYDEADLGLKDSNTYAPASGIISNMKLQAGEYVDKGVPIFSIIVSDVLWVEANFKETQLTWMREGQRAHVVADAYPDIDWPGVVTAIAPATGAEFAVLPPQNATGNWVKVVQRIPVHIQVQQPAGMPRLRAGMTVTVGVDTGVSRGLPRSIRTLVENGYLPGFLQPNPTLAAASQ